MLISSRFITTTRSDTKGRRVTFWPRKYSTYWNLWSGEVTPAAESKRWEHVLRQLTGCTHWTSAITSAQRLGHRETSMHWPRNCQETSLPMLCWRILCGFKIKFIVNNQMKAASGSKKRSLKTVSASVGIHLSSINQSILMAEGRQNQKPKQRRNDSYAMKPSKGTGNNGRFSRKEKFTKTRAETNWKKII